jgi:hypothetical protein
VRLSATPSERFSEENGFRVGRLKSSSFSRSSTERSDRAALKFTLTYELDDDSGEGTAPRTDATLTVEGNSYYNPDQKSVSEVFLEVESLEWKDETGEPRRKRNLYARMMSGLSLGSGGRSSPFVGTFVVNPLTPNSDAARGK